MKRKKVLGMFMVGALLLSMTGCGGEASKSQETAAETKNAETTVEAGSTAETTVGSTEKKKVVVWSNNRHDEAYMQEKIAEFNKNNEKGIEIEYVIQADDYTNLITLAASSNQLPDIMAISNSDQIDLKTFADAKIFQPITGYFTEEFKTTNEVDNKKYQNLNTLGEDIYWVPTSVKSGARLIYNKEIFEECGLEPPVTLDELVEDAKIITEKGKGDYYGVIFPGQSSPFGRWLEQIGELSGVKPYDYANGKFEFSGYKPLLKSVRQMFEDKSTFPGTESMKIDPIRTQFAAGKVGIHGNASQEVGVLTQQFPAQMEWGVALPPTYDGEIKGALRMEPQLGWAMSGQTKDPESAWAVIEYFGSLDFLTGYVEGAYGLAASKAVEAGVDYSKVGKMSEFTITEYEDVYPLMPAVTPEGDSFQDALWSACLPGGPDIDKTIETLNKTYNEALEKEIKMGKVKRLIVENYDPLHPSKGTLKFLSE